jgi:hypothetical protein
LLVGVGVAPVDVPGVWEGSEGFFPKLHEAIRNVARKMIIAEMDISL